MSLPLKEGDIIYSPAEANYHLWKILRIDAKQNLWHVLTYAPLNHVPQINDIHQLEVLSWHAPMTPIEDAEFLINRGVTVDDLQGYHYYLKTTDFVRYCQETNQEVETVIGQANEAFEEGFNLTDGKRYDEAIAKYGEAIALYPLFYEAIDNMGLVKMQQEKFYPAIEDFKWSLKLNPSGELAEFSLGDCYYRLADYATAIEHFDLVLERNPSNDTALLYREKALHLMEGGKASDFEFDETEPAPAPTPEVANELEPVQAIEPVVETVKEEVKAAPTPPKREAKTTPPPAAKKPWWKFW